MSEELEWGGKHVEASEANNNVQPSWDSRRNRRSKSCPRFSSTMCDPILRDEEARSGGEQSDEECSEGMDFMAVKPWLGAIFPPSYYIRDPKRPNNVMDEEHNNWGEPDMKLHLDYVYGYRARDCRNNLFWVDCDHIVYPAAAVGIVLDLKTMNEDFYFGHNDDILCLDYHPGKNLVASGSMGARDTARLCLWSVSPVKEKFVIFGFHKFAVVGVSFNQSGSIVASVGMDEHHSVALYSTDNGALLATCPADKNHVIELCFSTSSCVDQETCFVTVGVQHICFWTPKNTTLKEQNYYLVTQDPIEQRLDWQRGVGREIDRPDLIFSTVEFSTSYTLVGASNGSIYVFHSSRFELQLEFPACEAGGRILSIRKLTEDGNTFACGTGVGFIKTWDLEDAKGSVSIVPSKKVFCGDKSTLINMNALDPATKNPQNPFGNGVRSLCYDSDCGKLLVGTIMSQIHIIDVPKTTAAKVSDCLVLSAHWGNLTNSKEYGELWGVDTHPYEQTAVTACDDGTVRLWKLDEDGLAARFDTKCGCTCCSFSNDAKLVAVGHDDGTFEILSGTVDAQLVPPVSVFDIAVKAIRFSPDSKFLAVTGGKNVAIFDVAHGKKVDDVTVKRRGFCRGHVSSVRALDWNVASTVIQTVSNSYELLHFCVADCTRITGTRALADEIWFTQTCVLGWHVQGIWPRFADGTDVNVVAKSRSQKYLATVDDWGKVKIYNYPCIGSGLEPPSGRLRIRPTYDVYIGHCSHVTNCVWTFNDKYLLTTGGGDLSMFCWKTESPPCAIEPLYLNAGFIDKLNEAAERKCNTSGMSHLENSAMKSKTGAYSPQKGGDQAEATLPSECYMCGYSYGEQPNTSCPRCFAPRSKPTAKYHKVRTARAMRTKWDDPALCAMNEENEEGEATTQPTEKKKTVIHYDTESRFSHPTKSFASHTKLQQSLRARRAEEEAQKPKTWQPALSGGKPLLSEENEVDSDEEIARKHVSATTRRLSALCGEDGAAPPTAKKSLPPKKKAKPVVPKKTSGPDFRYF